MQISSDISATYAIRQQDVAVREPFTDGPNFGIKWTVYRQTFCVLHCSPSTVVTRSRHYAATLLFLLVSALLISTGVSSAIKSSCKKVGYRSVIDEAGCDLVAVFVNRCSGYCMSFSFPNPLQNNRLTVHAKCCRMIDVEMVDVDINCSDGVRTVKVPSALECGCFDCA